MRYLVPLIGSALVGCAAQMQAVGPYAGQLSKSAIQQIIALMPPDDTKTHSYTKLDTVRPNQVRVTVGGFARDTHGNVTSNSSNYTFTAVKRGDRWDQTGEVSLEREFGGH